MYAIETISVNDVNEPQLYCYFKKLKILIIAASLLELVKMNLQNYY